MHVAAAKAKVTAKAKKAAEAEESEGGSESEAEVDVEAVADPAQAEGAEEVEDMVGRHMEIQGCDPEVCEYVCSECPWEACEVTADDGAGTLDVTISSDGTICKGIVSHRFLRLPGKRARQQ